MPIKQNTSILFKLALLLFLVQLSFACAGANPLSPGAWVEEKNRIPVLQDGQQKGSWQTRDLSIAYQLKKEANRLEISGVVDLALT